MGDTHNLCNGDVIQYTAVAHSREEVLSSTVMIEKIHSFKNNLNVRGANISIMGIDGSGKTTLSAQLSDIFNQMSITNQSLSIYRIYKNIFTTPLILLYNRYFQKRILIFDRCIFDNIAVFFSTRPYLHCLLPVILLITRLLYPKFDYYFYLSASLEDTIARRRSEIEPQGYFRLTLIYNEITKRCKFHILNSTPTLLQLVLNIIADKNESENTAN